MLGIYLLFILMLASASATKVEIITPSNGDTLPSFTAGQIIINVSEYNRTFDDNLHLLIGHEQTTASYPYRYAYADVFDFNGNGSYTIDYPADTFIYPDLGYIIYVVLDPAENYSVSGYEADPADPGGNSALIYVDTGINTTYSDYLYLYDCDPWHLDFYAGKACGDGVNFKAYSLNNTAVPLYFFITDNSSERNLIDVYGLRSLAFIGNNTHPEHGNLVYSGQLPDFLNIKKDNFKIRNGYYIYFGVPASYYGDIGFTTDDTFMPIPMNFSTDGFVRGKKLQPDSHILDNDYYGFCIYFETYPTPGSITDWGAGSKPDTTLSIMLRSYFSDLGFPWGFILIGLLPPALCVGMVYQFGRKFRISMPNFIYALMIDAGAVISYIIGIFDFWMTAFLVVMTTLAMIYVYREPLNIAYTTVAGVPYERRREVTAYEAIGERERKRTPIAVEEGVKQRRLLRPSRPPPPPLSPDELMKARDVPVTIMTKTKNGKVKWEAKERRKE